MLGTGQGQCIRIGPAEPLGLLCCISGCFQIFFMLLLVLLIDFTGLLVLNNLYFIIQYLYVALIHFLSCLEHPFLQGKME